MPTQGTYETSVKVPYDMYMITSQVESVDIAANFDAEKSVVKTVEPQFDLLQKVIKPPFQNVVTPFGIYLLVDESNGVQVQLDFDTERKTSKDIDEEFDTELEVIKGLDNIGFDTKRLISKNFDINFDTQINTAKGISEDFDTKRAVGFNVSDEFDTELTINKDIDTNFDIKFITFKHVTDNFDTKRTVATSTDLVADFDTQLSVSKNITTDSDTLISIKAPISEDFDTELKIAISTMEEFDTIQEVIKSIRTNSDTSRSVNKTFDNIRFDTKLTIRKDGAPDPEEDVVAKYVRTLAFARSSNANFRGMTGNSHWYYLVSVELIKTMLERNFLVYERLETPLEDGTTEVQLTLDNYNKPTGGIIITEDMAAQLDIIPDIELEVSRVHDSEMEEYLRLKGLEIKRQQDDMSES